MKKNSLIVSSLIVISVGILIFTSAKEPIVGHYHVHKIKKLSPIKFGEMIGTLDVMEDDSAFFGLGLSKFEKNRVFTQKIDYKNNEILFGGECRILDFEFRTSDSNLLLRQIEYSSESEYDFYAEKCNLKCEEKESHYFSLIELEINLPRLNQSYQGNKLINESNFHPSQIIPIYFGIPKEDYQKHFGKKPRFRINKLDDSSMEEKIRIVDSIAVAAEQLNKIEKYFAIFADKETPMDMIYQFIEMSKKKKQRLIWGVVVENNDNQFNVFFKKLNLHKINRADFVETLTWEKFLIEN